MNALRRHLLASATCVALASCVPAGAAPDSGPVPPPSIKTGAPVDQAWAEVTRLRGDAACSSDAQCHSIGVGSKPCGGPSAYLAWSSAQQDGAALAAAVQRHAELAKASNQVAGRVSTCSVVPDPGAVCKAADNKKRCALQER